MWAKDLNPNGQWGAPEVAAIFYFLSSGNYTVFVIMRIYILCTFYICVLTKMVLTLLYDVPYQIDLP